MVVFNNVENAGLEGRGSMRYGGLPWLWHDFAPDTGDGKARSEEGLVIDPHGRRQSGIHRQPLQRTSRSRGCCCCAPGLLDDDRTAIRRNFPPSISRS